MPPTPEPDEDDLDAVHRAAPVGSTSAGPLGPALLDPHRIDDVSGIAADSFSTAAHAALYAAISTLPRPDPAEHAKNTKWLDHVLTAGREQARGLTALPDSLCRLCPGPARRPLRPVSRRHGPRPC
ncbi:hypothetical protein [Streptomyces sp. DHE17-7]|uniref:hypothetical protein n=1 Tax=Streptomyces sp. DHE17-7 TaxID=2759949 RepID=UPI0022EAAD4B|nr:hypothetical protein [Streptomyces sp. DHE17-7]